MPTNGGILVAIPSTEPAFLEPIFGQRGPKASDPVPRFWSFVLKVEETEGGCWLWQGAVGSHGYGSIYAYGRQVLVHRLSWEIHNGPIPKGMHVLHHCDVRRCIRPNHLFLGTNKDNHADAQLKGRLPAGEAHKSSKLTALQVQEIRRRSSLGESRRSVSRDFDITPQTVGKIVRGERWQAMMTS